MAGNIRIALPMPVIQAAIEGDGEALAAVVKHYQGYIRYLAIRPLKDEYGNEYLCVDEDMRLRLEAKLIHSIVTGFKILPA
ncbi:helix-turn-helix domain-containing protein [Oscillospiraceae bacterium OttesenSCG-928-F05]|nr:helix-turn-helix domain-containing protein [Oscillospiraceae bacterium OttesenSCG-928-F05]